MNFIYSFFVLICFIIFCKTLTVDPKKSSNVHAVIVAGAGGLDNYFSQSSACRVYHLLRDQGVPAENIIHLAFDDIANDPDNPIPGKILNEPNGIDVNAGCIKDYTGDDCSHENFLKVLKGDKELAKKGKKVLQTGPDDNVFIYFNDHGGPGVIYFVSNPVTSYELNNTLTYMYEHQMYGKLTFYLMTCESGSMFENILSPDINVYAVTSSKADELSTLSYCSYKGIPSCLSDEFTVAWMKNAKKSDPSIETLQAQFLDIRSNVKHSTAQQYGTISIADSTVGQFEGESKTIDRNWKTNSDEINEKHLFVNRRDATMYYWQRRLEMASDNERDKIKSKLTSIIEGRRFYDRAIRNIINELCRSGFCSNVDNILSKRLSLVNHETYSLVVKKIHSNCIDMSVNTYALNYLYAFVNIIESQSKPFDLQRFMFKLSRVCAHHIGYNGFNSIV